MWAEQAARSKTKTEPTSTLCHWHWCTLNQKSLLIATCLNCLILSSMSSDLALSRTLSSPLAPPRSIQPTLMTSSVLLSPPLELSFSYVYVVGSSFVEELWSSNEVHYTQYYVILEIANIHSCVLSMIGFCPNFQSWSVEPMRLGRVSGVAMYLCCTVLHKWKFEFR